LAVNLNKLLGHLMMLFTLLQSNKKIKIKLEKEETKMLKEFSSDNYIFKVRDGIKILWMFLNPDKYSLPYQYSMCQLLTKRSQEMINQFTVALFINTQRELTNI
jgi:hypothetical protein